MDRNTTAHKVLRPQVSHALPVPSEAIRQEKLTQVSVLSVPLATTAKRELLIQNQPPLLKDTTTLFKASTLWLVYKSVPLNSTAQMKV